MVSLKPHTLDEYVSLLSSRADKFALVLDSADVTGIVRDCIRKLDQIVSYPRVLILNDPPKSVALPENVDSILNVKFSNEMLDPFIKEFGIIPLVSRQFPLSTLEQASEFLLLKGSLNMLSRHLKFAPDWAYYPPNLILNNSYHHVLVEYLPYLDGDAEATEEPPVPPETEPAVIPPSWILNSTEHAYIIERAWALMNKRNAEALITASYIGVGTEYSSVLSHWTESVDKLDEDFTKGSVITYLG